MTIAATVVSVLCSGTLVADFYQTPDFKKNGPSFRRFTALSLLTTYVTRIWSVGEAAAARHRRDGAACLSRSRIDGVFFHAGVDL